MKGLDPNVPPKKDFVISFAYKYSTTHTRGTVGLHWESGLLAATIKKYNTWPQHSKTQTKPTFLPFTTEGKGIVGPNNLFKCKNIKKKKETRHMNIWSQKHTDWTEISEKQPIVDFTTKHPNSQSSNPFLTSSSKFTYPPHPKPNKSSLSLSFFYTHYCVKVIYRSHP